MSELPDGWVQIALGEALQIQKGKKPIGLGPKGDDRLVPYINISAFETKLVKEYAPEQDVPHCEPSDTLLVWDGARAGLAGRGIGGFIGSTLARLTSDLADPSYIYYFVHSNYGYLNTHTKGVGIPHIDPIVLAEIAFPLPPSGEQTRIVAKLEELLSDLDAGVAELKAAQKKLVHYRQSLLKAAVEGVLTAEWRTQHIPTETGAQLLERILTERRVRWETKQLVKFKEQGKTPPKDWQKKYPEPMQPDTTDLPELPEGWVWASVDQVAEVFLGKMLDKTKHTSGEKLAYLRNVNVRWGSIEIDDVYEMFFNIDELERYGLIAGDVLVCEGGEPGRAAICRKEHERFKYQKALHRVRMFNLYEPELLVAFLEFVAQTGRLAKTFTGSTINHFTKESFVALCIPLPAMAEQRMIVEHIAAEIRNISDQESAIGLSLKQSTAQRQNILRAAFAGQLVPQDPNDESASALLESIRAERVEREKQPKIRKTKQQKEIAAMVSKLIHVLAEEGDWVSAQEAFRRCGVADGALTDQIEGLYAELRALDKAGRLAVEAVTDAQGRKLHDRLKLLPT
ncbi:restriction endonuclease subunit S [Nitrosospira sp. NRS527]|uniref:restriction endonuclease subunit S n=1 Tax=Nitrosospira sp. NRS527 TaxID=155925 RepID=UPI001AFAC5DA|nr:restriction endonuclease subunit S [Nitrosospira sp. NRS527]BCT68876.1 hypothetical protein NNRS527_02483 [Nitrosospira sp. NRS527]